MKDSELQKIVLRRYYTKRRESFIPVNEENFGGQVALPEVLRISQQLHELGLIEFRPLTGDDTIVTGWGRITALGVHAVERVEMNTPIRERSPLAQLRTMLDKRFNESELRTLCFDLGVDYSNLPGEGKADKARELVAYLERRDRIHELTAIAKRSRPDIPWDDVSGVPAKTSSGSRNPAGLPRSKFSFETGSMGWIPQDYEDSRACVQVLRSDDVAKEGQYSLKMLMDLVGGDKHKSKGEAWVNMLDNAPPGEHIPLDLTNRTVTAWVYAPHGSRGDRSKPNGIQLFVKDQNWKSEYGSWNNVVEGQWVQISLTVSASRPRDGWMDQGFDPGRIIAIGFKMGSGGGSTATYKGPVYVDAVDW